LSDQVMTIDGRRVAIEGERNILEVARKAGIDIPNFCYHSELSVYGACRLCLVEVEGRGLVASCSTAPEAGLKVRTSTPRVQRLRRMTLELLLANHDRECTTCPRSGSCRLQELATRLGLDKVRFGKRDERLPVDRSSPALVRDPNKCILCGDCVRVCHEVQGIGAIDFAYRGARTTVAPALGKNLGDVDCVSCGQCAQVCPTAALTVKSDVDRVWEAIHDPETTVVAQVAPAVRVSLGEMFGLDAGTAVAGRLVTALKSLGVDRVFDTNLTADLTAWEETYELLARLEARRSGKDARLPLLTSCCPAWVRYCEQYHAELLGNLSTCRSPQQMMGSVLKNHWAKRAGLDPGRVFVVSVMPCSAKKVEAARPEFAPGGRPEVDAVLTTQEVARLIREAGLDLCALEEQPFDSPLGLASGAAVIFGTTGGVAEAVVRTAAGVLGGEEAPRVEFEPVRGLKGVKEARVDLGSYGELRLCVVHGLGNARRVLRHLKEGRAAYDVVEVMACPGGCVGGGGQPRTDERRREARARGLYRLDRQSQLHRPQDNPQVARLYREWLGEPGSEAAHRALHTHYHPHRRLHGVSGQAVGRGRVPDTRQAPDAEWAAEPLEVSVCVGTGCYLKGSHRVLRELARAVTENGLAGRVRLGATFCLERCDGGVSVKVGDRVLTGVRPESAAEVFQREILPEAVREESTCSRSRSA